MNLNLLRAFLKSALRLWFSVRISAENPFSIIRKIENWIGVQRGSLTEVQRH